MDAKRWPRPSGEDVKTTRGSSGRLSELLVADPPLWAAWVLLGRLGSKAKSAIAGRLLRAPGLYLGPGCVIRGSRFIRFGRRVYAHGHLWLEAVSEYRGQRFSPRIEIGDGVSFSEGVHISSIERISIGERVLFGSRVYVSDHNHGLYKGPGQSSPEEPPAERALGGGGAVEIGDNAWIGDNVVIVGPLRIGRGSIIGANSVVRADVPDSTMAAGVPARPLRRFDALSGAWGKL
jgi:lipopolysaccharide O-acetyltransferase